MPGYVFATVVAQTMAVTDPRASVPNQTVGFGNGFFRLYSWKFKGAFVPGLGAGAQLYGPSLAVVEKLNNPKTQSGTGVFDTDTFISTVAAGVSVNIEFGNDYSSEGGRLFVLNAGGAIIPAIGFVDFAGTNYSVSGILTINYGYDMMPQAQPTGTPGPL
jgi:hypothetical protein